MLYICISRGFDVKYTGVAGVAGVKLTSGLSDEVDCCAAVLVSDFVRLLDAFVVVSVAVIGCCVTGAVVVVIVVVVAAAAAE